MKAIKLLAVPISVFLGILFMASEGNSEIIYSREWSRNGLGYQNNNHNQNINDPPVMINESKLNHPESRIRTIRRLEDDIDMDEIGFVEGTDIFCDELYYTTIETIAQNAQAGEWVCNIKGFDLQYFIHQINGVPPVDYSFLMDNIASWSGSMALLLKDAFQFLDLLQYTIFMDPEVIQIDLFPRIGRGRRRERMLFTNDHNLNIFHKEQQNQLQRSLQPPQDLDSGQRYKGTRSVLRKEQQHQLQRSLQPPVDPDVEQRYEGTKTVLVLRVTGRESHQVLTSHGTVVDAAELSRRWFGGSDDNLNLRDGYIACSNNKLIFEKAEGNPKIVNGVMEVKIDVDTDAEGEKPLGVNSFLENAVADAAKEALGTITELEEMYDHVVMCLPEGTNIKTAYARIGGRRSVFNGEWCLWPSAQMHEIGHNLRLQHSNEGRAYEDKIGIMGFSYVDDHEFPRMCFNGAKSWLLGWYGDKNRIVRPIEDGSSFMGNLVGVADYNNAREDDYVILAIPTGEEAQNEDKILMNTYITFNAERGIHDETQEYHNLVIVTDSIVRLTSFENDLREEYPGSESIAALAEGEVHKIANYINDRNLNIKACEIETGINPPYANVAIFMCDDADPCPETPSNAILDCFGTFPPTPTIAVDECSGEGDNEFAGEMTPTPAPNDNTIFSYFNGLLIFTFNPSRIRWRYFCCRMTKMIY